MLGTLVQNKMLQAILWGTEVCRAGGNRDPCPAVHHQPVYDPDVGLFPTKERCTKLRELLLLKRQGILSEIARLEGERKDIEAVHCAFIEQKREGGFSRYRRVVGARTQRDAELSREQAAIEALERRMAEKKDEIGREEQARDAGMVRLQDDLRQLAASEQDAGCREAERVRMEAEAARLQDDFAAFQSAAGGEIQASADEMAERRQRVCRVEEEFMELQWMVNEERDVADLELVEGEARYDASTRTLDSLVWFHRERLAAVDGRLCLVGARMHGLG